MTTNTTTGEFCDLEQKYTKIEYIKITPENIVCVNTTSAYVMNKT